MIDFHNNSQRLIFFVYNHKNKRTYLLGRICTYYIWWYPFKVTTVSYRAINKCPVLSLDREYLKLCISKLGSLFRPSLVSVPVEIVLVCAIPLDTADRFILLKRFCFSSDSPPFFSYFLPFDVLLRVKIWDKVIINVLIGKKMLWSNKNHDSRWSLTQKPPGSSMTKENCKE